MDIRKRQRKLSKLQEKRAANDIGGKVIPASGALPHSKGDVRLSGEYLIECKYTEADKYILKRNDLLKIRGEAFKKAETPLFLIEFKGINKGKYVIVPYKGDPYITITGMQVILNAVELREQISTPIVIMQFDDVPIINSYRVAIFEWNKYLKEIIKDNDRN